MKAFFGPAFVIAAIFALIWLAPPAAAETQYDLRHGSSCWGYPERSGGIAAPRNEPGTQRTLDGLLMISPPTGELAAFCDITPTVRTSSTTSTHFLFYYRFTFVAQPGVTLRTRLCTYGVSSYSMTCGADASHPAATAGFCSSAGNCVIVTTSSQVVAIPQVRIDQRGIFLMVIAPPNSRATLRALQTQWY